MARRLIYFREAQHDHLVYVDVPDELWDDARPPTLAETHADAIRAGLARVAPRAHLHVVGGTAR
jgi:hypothetical protein